jgi:hypothetical protein
VDQFENGLSKSLWDEISGWESVDSDLFSSINLVTHERVHKAVFTLEPIPNVTQEAGGYRAQNARKGSFGWLGKMDRGEKGDHWRFHLADLTHSSSRGWQKPGRWTEAVLPRRWNGAFQYLMVSERTDMPTLLVGDAWSGRGLATWVVLGRERGCPDWAKLEAGKDCEYTSSDLAFLGVLWRMRNLSEAHHNWEQASDFKPELYAAYADQSGAFLGWELINTMGRGLKSGPDDVLRLQALPEWDQVEVLIRDNSLGRSI